MPQITRTWLGFAALGAGLIHLALVVSSPLPIGIVLAGLGVAEFGWGVLTFARDRLVLPQVARIVAIAPVILWSLLVVTATLLDTPGLASSLTLVPMAVATLFGLFAAAVLSRYIRRQQGTDAAADAPAMPSAGRYLLALTVGGVLVGALTTPALAATDAGRYAQPHGDHNPDFVPTKVAESDPLSDLVVPGHDGH